MESTSSRSGHRATARILIVLLVICLVESATGSCLSYGHSCWGAHGKRSGKPPMSAPDWYFNRMLRRLAANAEMSRENFNTNDDTNAIYQLGVEDSAPASDKMVSASDEEPAPLPFSRNLEAKPMLDDNVLSNYKIWQLMTGAHDEK